MLALYQVFLQERISVGEAPKGLDKSFAALVEISPSMWSQIKSSRAISDKLARQIERHTSKDLGWLDVEHVNHELPDAAEERFVAAARLTWRASNAKGKRELMRLLKDQGRPVYQSSPC